MEIYLCHMVIFRLLERLELLRMFDNDTVNFIVLTAMVLGGAIVFSLIFKKVISLFSKGFNWLLTTCSYKRKAVQ